MTLRIVDTGLNSARWNAGMTAALAELHRTDRVVDTLRFYRSAPAVLLGQHQNPRRAVNLERLMRRKIDMARRITGGTPVYVDPGILALDLVIDLRKYGTRLSNAIAQVCTGLAAGLARMGPPARFQPSGRIVIDARHVGQITGTFDGLTMIFQGFIHIDVSADTMTDALAPAASGRATADHARSASLADFLGRVPAAQEVIAVLAAGLANELRVQSAMVEASPEEIALAARLADEFDDEKLSVKSETQGPLHIGRKQAASGTIEAYLRLTPGAERLVEQVRIAGDFSIAPIHAMRDLERALHGVPANDVADHAQEILQSSVITMSGAAPADIAGAIAAAVRNKPVGGSRTP